MLKTTIVLISHQTPAEVSAMAEAWQRLNPEAEIHVAYGGAEERFAEVHWPRRTWIGDARLRTRDHQRERQSYRGLMQAMAESLGGRGVDRVVLVECDVAPLQPGLAAFLNRRGAEERADVLGARLRRVDGTSHPHYLAHLSHPQFQSWLEGTVRPEADVVLMMLGCLTWWTWEAFVATARAAEPLPVYLELAMPTTAHHLGFRVRGLPEWDEDLAPLGERAAEREERAAAGAWVLHPCKELWRAGTVAAAGGFSRSF